MRIVYRDKDNRNYWDERWRKAGVDQDGFRNEDIYPIKYANMVVNDPSQRVLEAGCGTGRVFFHYRKKGYAIRGLEYSSVAVEAIRGKEPAADVVCGNITALPYADAEFDVVLAFGLYHNLEREDDRAGAFRETSRVLKTGGRLVASVRYDSFENNLVEWIMRKRSAGKRADQFHRCHFDRRDLERYLKVNGMVIEKFFYARNVSFLFKFDMFRAAEMKSGAFRESEARSRGFALNPVGRCVDAFLHGVFPWLFSNLIIVIARKNV